MFNYISRLYYQIKTLYTIKTYIDIIYNTYENEEKLLLTFDNLKKLIFNSGSLYIKFFQWYISKLKSNIINNNDPDTKHIIKFINYFEDIFEQCPYHDITHTYAVFKASMYGISINDYVDITTLKRIASGSIGQVYYAKRKRDGIEIAIKVKHPDIEKDLINQYELLTLIKYLQSFNYLRFKFNLLFNIDDFLEDINLQCDFNNEANNTTIFRENFKDSSNYIIFPEVLYQSRDLLISIYIDGNSVNSLSDVQKYQTSINFICFFKQMLFIDNFIHGDLHCKNWKVKYNEETKNTQIIVYDCGICFKNISTDLTLQFWMALIKYDVDEIIILLKEFIKNTYINSNNIQNFNFSDEKINQKFDNDIKNIFKDIITQSMGTSIIMKSILNFFKINNIMVHKFLLNFTILVCVIEEYMKSNNLINKNINENITMFDIINDSQFDIIAFCTIKKCYPKLKDIYEIQIKNNFTNYKINNENNKLEQNENENENKKLFSSITLSKLTFKPPE